jgi:hypothetical protein
MSIQTENILLYVTLIITTLFFYELFSIFKCNTKQKSQTLNIPSDKQILSATMFELKTILPKKCVFYISKFEKYKILTIYNAKTDCKFFELVFNENEGLEVLYGLAKSHKEYKKIKK